MRTKLNPMLWWRTLEATPPNRVVAASAAAIAAIGVGDHFTGPIVSLAIVYLVPVALAAWVAGRGAAYLLAFLAAIVWAVADRIGPLAEPKAAIAYLNDASMLLVFWFVSFVIAALREQIRQQRELMQDVQRRLLPATVPQLPGLEVASRWIPAWTVAGDYYDLISAGEGRVAICLADVSGKGMPAALIMSNVQATVRVLAARGLAPDRMLSALNAFLHARLRRGLFVTMFYGVLDTARGVLTFASAGHTPAVLKRRDGSLVRLESTGPVAGIFPAAEYRLRTVDVEVGERLFVYSDGITEFENAAGEEFGERRLLEVLQRDPGGPAEQTCAQVVEALQQFGGTRPYIDDVTMLVIARTEEPAAGAADVMAEEPLATV